MITLDKALAKAEPEMRAAFLQMVATMQSSIKIGDLADLLEAGRFEEALAQMLAAAPRLGIAQSRTFIAAANDVAEQIGKELGNIIVDFDQTNEFAVQAMRRNQLRLVSGFTTQQTEATRLILTEGIRRGDNPRTLARLFRQSIGLTPNQVRAVNAYRRALEQNDRDSLNRTLRDRRFDATVQRALERNEPLTRSQIDKMVNRYRERQIAHRAKVVARTESLRAVHEGSEAMFAQAVETGNIDPANMRREWNTALDERVRGTHRTMHGQVRGMGEPFVSGSGASLRHPGDPDAPAQETIQCRCTLGTRIIGF